MTPAVLMWLAIAVGGALVVWHNVSRTKQVTEELLRAYREALTESRVKKARELAAKAEEAERERENSDAQ